MKGCGIRVLIAGPCPMHYALLSEYLSRQPDLEVVGRADASYENAGSAAGKSGADVILLDRCFHGGNDASIESDVPRSGNVLSVFICASCAEESRWNRFRSNRNHIAVSACRGPESLLQAIRSVQGGDRGMQRAPHMDCPAERFRRARGLTKTELVVLSMIARGFTNRAAARELGVSIRTVENHRHRLRKKLGIGRTAKLVHEAARIGLDDVEVQHEAPEN